jgi:hypothetical protein
VNRVKLNRIAPFTIHNSLFTIPLAAAYDELGRMLNGMIANPEKFAPA